MNGSDLEDLLSLDKDQEISALDAEKQVIDLVHKHNNGKWFKWWSDAINGRRNMSDVLQSIQDELAI